MSKSGVFAHFGSREDLQLAVLEFAATRFGEFVLVAALAQPRGLPRLRAIMRNWFEWGRLEAGGCVLVGSVTEYDDRPGPLRDLVLRNEQRWRDALQRAAQLAIDCGHLRDEIGRAHLCTPVTNAHLVCRLLLDKKKYNTYTPK